MSTMAAPSLPSTPACSADNALERELKCSACGNSGGEFSNRQRNKLMMGEPGRCKQCVQNNTPVNKETKEEEARHSTPKENDRNPKETSGRLYFSDGGSIADPSSTCSSSSSSSSSSANGTKEKERNDNDDDNQDVSLNALKEQILGRKIVTHVESSEDNEEEAFPTISNASQLRNELSCPICHEPLFQPLSLHCGHSFCSNCLQWWLGHSQEGTEHGTCPTCREHLVCRGDSLRVNTALRAALTALYGEELQKRNQVEKLARLKAMAGENGGAHDRGYEVLSKLQEEPWKRLNVGDEMQGFLLARRSIVLDAQDVRMHLALAVDCRPGVAPPTLVDYRMLQVTLCLLSMEEDEAADGGFPVLVQDEDDEHLISNEDRFHGAIKATIVSPTLLDGDSLNNVPIAREAVSNDGTVCFQIPLTKKLSEADYVCVRFFHEICGAEYEIKLSRKERQEWLGEQVGGDRVTDTSRFVYMDMDNESDLEENEYEDDGFLVMNEEEEEPASDSEESNNEQDICCVCKEHGELIVCDGGEHLEGCGKSFHIQCINRDEVPPGDWICGNCASTIDLDVGIKGHEFSATASTGAAQRPCEDMDSRKSTKRVLDDSSEDESDEVLEAVAPVSKSKVSATNKRSRILESDSDDE